MRRRPLLALTAPALVLPLSLGVGSGCTSDLPAPYNYEVLEPPPPPNELEVDCASLPLTAEGAQYSQTPTITGQLEDASYRYSATNLPEGLVIDEDTGVISGTATTRGDYRFEVTIEDVADPENYSATGTCNLQVNPRLSAPIDVDTACLRAGQDLRDFVLEGTGDGSAITCDIASGSGNGRRPNGIEADSEGCTITGTITNRAPTMDNPFPLEEENRYGTWVFMVRGTQSGAEVFVPYCVTNDVAQGYDITVRHSGNDDAGLLPLVGTYDPTAAFTVGADMDPRFEITSPGICGASCFFKYSFLRTNAPFDGDTFTLDPDGLLQDGMGMGQNIGFFHELHLSGPAVPAEFIDRPWILSVTVSYCLSGSDTCGDAALDGDAIMEFAVLMFPDRG
jgi:hypothetical protein